MTFNEIQGNPSVHVGIMDAPVVRFVLNGAFEVRGRSVTGEQVVEWAGGGVLWQGERYDGLLFEPQGDGSTFTLCDVKIGKTYH